LHVKQFYNHAFPWVFLFEKNYLEKFFIQGNIYGQIQDRHFIDIRIPAEYERAQKELPLQILRLEDIDSSWTIFIDRDGVINQEKKDDYIKNKAEFHFYDAVPEAFQILAKKAGLIIIISNQRGVGKGLMTEEDLLGIHQYMQAEIKKAGGRVDAIYYCTHTDPHSPQRKPNPGMARRAKHDFPGIAFPRSVMIGNKPSDMLFGRNAGMHTVFIASTHPETAFPHPDIDLRFNSLAEFVKAL
jgi:D-glycero-alpha-D-manno-heptose 1-phosphate guanylyltransferase